MNFVNFTINLNEFPKTVYVKGTNVNNCSKVKSVILEHKPEVPLVSNSVELLECDANNDDVAIFNLTASQSLITAEAGVTFTYYTSIPNMQANTNSILNPTVYQNLAPNPSVVYVRLSSPATNCDTWATITLNPFYENYALPAQITLCDNNADGTEEVDLDQEILDGLPTVNPATIALEFYNSASDATSGINMITNSHTYIFTNFATPLFVKITNLATGCPIIKQLNFINPIPILLTPSSVSLCDFNRSSSEQVNLSNYFNLLSATPNAHTITSYHTETGANNAVLGDQISNTAYLLSQPQKTFWIRFQDSNGCYSVTSLTISIIPLPNPNTNPLPIQLCDDTNPGDLAETFNIATYQNYILNGSTDLITYHSSLPDAQSGINPIGTSYSGPTGSVWIRVTANPVSTITNCAIIVEQKLIVNPLPLAGVISDYYSCINANTLTATFNLSTKNIEVLSGQNPNQFTVRYHNTQQEAKDNLNPLPFVYTSVSKTIWASIRNNATGCINVSPLQLITEPVTTATQPDILNTTFCDTVGANNGSIVFDLSNLNAEILGANQTVSNYEVHYFASINDLNSNLPIADLSAFENTSNPQTIYVTVTNNATVNKCAASISFDFKVNLLPEPTPNDGTVCYDHSTGNLVSSYIIDSHLSSTAYTFEWFEGTNPVPIANQTGSTLEVTNAGDYFVIATNILTHCESEPAMATVIKSESAVATARVEYSFNDIVNIVVNTNGLGNYNYQLDDSTIQESPLFTNVSPGTHTVTVLDLNGCNDTTLEVIVLNYDKFFTPNGDGYNDHWQIEGVYDQPNATIYIFDRYGRLLKQLYPRGLGWDGTFNGNRMPADDYWFTVTYIENGEQKEFKSHFAMKR